MAELNVNSKGIVELSNKLEKLGRADMPVAVRATLNNASFRMKGQGTKRGEIDKAAERGFQYTRSKKLFKAITGVKKATGLEISNMKSTAGVINRSGLTHVADGLEAQEYGKPVKSKSTPLNRSRVGRNQGKKIRSAALMKKQGKAIFVKSGSKNRFIARAITAKKRGVPLIVRNAEGSYGNKFVARVGYIRKRRGKSPIINLHWLYRINSEGTVHPSVRVRYIHMATAETVKEIEKDFKEQAQKRINKYYNK